MEKLVLFYVFYRSSKKDLIIFIWEAVLKIVICFKKLLL